MAKTVPDRALAALLSFEDERDDKVLAEGALPTLKKRVKLFLRVFLQIFAGDRSFVRTEYAVLAEDALPTFYERVELFLRAKYGEDRTFTASERAEAYTRILDAIKDNSAHEVNAQVRTDFDVRNAEVEVEGWSEGQRRLPSGIIARLFELSGSLLVASRRASPITLAAASLATLLLIGAGWSVAWFYSARAAQSAVATWRETEARSGLAYQCDSQSIGGFPFRVVMQCTGPTVKVAWDQSTIIVDAKQIRAVASFLHPNVLSVEITDPIWVWEHNKPAFLANWTQARVTIDNTLSRLEHVSVAIDGGQFYRMTQAGKQLLLTSEKLEAELGLNTGSDKAGPAFDITAHVAGGFLPSGALPSRPFQADVTAIVTDIPEDWPKDFSTRLREWQANVGRVVIRSARIQQDDAVAVAQGDVGLNDDGRVEGNLRAGVTGHYVPFFVLLVRDAVKRNRIAEAPQAGPQIHTRTELPIGTDPGTGTTPISPDGFAIRLADGTVYIDGVRVGNLPALYLFASPNTHTFRSAPGPGVSLLPR
jgi:hypothetical protein